MSDTVRFKLNGAEANLDAPADEPLLFALRNRLGLRATHFGCGLEQCGACVVDVDGRASYSCTLPLAAVAGTSVTTVEGLAANPVGVALLDAFRAEHAGQCGYCLSGILMSAFVLLKGQADPDKTAIRAALERHLCRCGAHGGILRAVGRAAAALEGKQG